MIDRYTNMRDWSTVTQAHVMDRPLQVIDRFGNVCEGVRDLTFRLSLDKSARVAGGAEPVFRVLGGRAVRSVDAPPRSDPREKCRGAAPG